MTETQHPTVAIVGLGSIGGAAAGCLGEAGQAIIACVRRPLEHLVFEHPRGVTDVPLRSLTDPAQAEPVDWVLLATKAHATASAAAWLARLCRKGTHVAVLQNGIDHAARVAPFVGEATVVPVIVYYNGERLAPDRVRLRSAGDADLAVADDTAGRAFAQLMAGTQLRIVVSPDFTTLLWRKLLINAVANPMTALTRQRQAVLRRADIHALCLTVLEEVTAVGRAAGAKLADDEPARTMATLMTYPPEVGTSMYFDTLAGRPLEVEALTGAIVATGARLGVPTPVNQTLLTLLRGLDEGARVG